VSTLIGKGNACIIRSSKKVWVLIVKRRTNLAILSFLTIAILVQGIPVSAHNPSANSISYHYINQQLSVTFNHDVTDVNTHYIHQVVVEVNSVVVLTRDYTSQNTTSSMSAVYNMTLVDGDNIRVTAKCVISGQYTQELELTTFNPTSTNTGTPIDSTLIIGIAIVVIGVVAVVVALVRRR
jgi:hypothetical protein